MEEDFKHIVRIANTDLKGEKPLIAALKGIKGVGYNFASAICRLASVPSGKKTGSLTTTEVDALNKVITDPLSAGVPTWFVNRRKDNQTGEDIHIITNTLILTKDNDLKMMKKMRSYKGVRHMFYLPVRGQRTRSNFRPNKGKVTGVKRKSKASKTGK